MENTDDYRDIYEAVSSCIDGRKLNGIQERLPHLSPQRIKDCLNFLIGENSLTVITMQREEWYVRSGDFNLRK